jgi:hypothetical protein
MAKHELDKKTPDLLPADIAPVPAKRGRPAKHGAAMSAAERKRASRAAANRQAVDLDRAIVQRLHDLYPGKSLDDAIAALLVAASCK